jgi:hypothetical protein
MVMDLTPASRRTLLSEEDNGQTARAAVLSLVCATCIAFIWRNQVWNGFSLLQGDRYDAVIQASILEHWFNVYNGTAHWSDAGYFYPYKLTIAQTDAFFLIGLVYTPLRWAGADPFLAAELSGMVLKAIGFLGMHAFMRRVLNVSFPWAVLAAILFTLNNGMTAHGQRLQVATVAFAPLLGLLLWEAWSAFRRAESKRLLAYGTAAAVLYGAWCMTCFYMAWFFAYFALFVVGSALATAGAAGRSRLIVLARSQVQPLALLIAVALVALTPFIYAFGSKWLETGARSYDTVIQNTVPVPGILEVGGGNLLLGAAYSRFAHAAFPGYEPYGEYYNTGFAIVLFAVFALACVRFIRAGDQSERARLLLVVALATLGSWLFSINIAGYSLWIVVFTLLPGAAALNVVAQYQIFLAFPVVMIAVAYLSGLRPSIWLVPLSLLLIAEEANTPSLNLDRATELDRASVLSPAPAECSAFYVSGWRHQDQITLDGGPMRSDPKQRSDREWLNNAYAHNVSAMFIAQRLGLPTINGFNSFNPPDWNSTHPNRPDYDRRMQDYAKRHGIDVLCRLDLNDKTWSKDYRYIEPPVEDASVIDFRRYSWDGVIKSMRDISHAEDWGTWSDGSEPTLEFTHPLPDRFVLEVTAHAFGPNVGKPIGVRVGAGEVQTFTLGDKPVHIDINLDNPDKSSLLTFNVPSPTSPRSLSQGNDPRLLGIGFAKLRIIVQP